LSGEAIFEVKSTENLPFIVNIEGSRTVTALGTEFFVSAYRSSGDFITGLIEGSIQVKTEMENFIINDPETLIFSSSNGEILERTDLKEYQLAWKNGKLIFENTDLEEIARRLSNWYNISIFTGESLKNQRFTLTIEDENPTEVLDLLKLASELDYKKTDEGYMIMNEKN
jgi:ferric-dicitrate binding protein FerR (iron transport regulator)